MCKLILHSCPLPCLLRTFIPMALLTKRLKVIHIAGTSPFVNRNDMVCIPLLGSTLYTASPAKTPFNLK